MAGAEAYRSLFDDEDFETEEEQELDDELQRVVHSYQARPASHEDEARLAEASSSQPFATAENLRSSIAYLSSSLAAYGFPAELPLQSGRPADAAAVCNTLHAMLHARQRDLERHRDAEDAMARLEGGIAAAQQARGRLEARLAAKDKEIGGLENKLRAVESGARAETSRLSAEAAELARANTDLQRRHVQFQHELRRREREFERLQAKLHEVLTERRREAKANADAASKLSEGGGSSSGRAGAGRRDEELFKRVVAVYEERQREVLAENRELRSALESLQAEHRTMTNQQAQRAQQLAAVKRTVDEEFAAEIAELTPAAAEAKLRGKLQALGQAVGLLAAESSAAAASPTDGVRSAGTSRLMSQVRAGRRLLAELQAVARLSLDQLASLATGGGCPAPGTAAAAAAAAAAGEAPVSPTVRRLEQEYRAKVWDLESKMASAQLQSPDGGSARFEAERRRVDEARLALVGEKARIAKALEQQGERLQQEAFDLGQAKWEFENTRAAFQDTMRQFAPGFGAGTFLAKAIAKRSALAAQERGGSDSASAAGKRAADAIRVGGATIGTAVE